MSQDVENQTDAPEPFGTDGRRRARAATRAELLAEFRAYLTALNRSPNTINATLRPLKPFFAFIDDLGLDLRAVQLKDIEAYKLGLQKGGRYAAHTVDTYLRAVRRLYVWLERTGRILISPVDGLTMPKIQDALPRTILTATETRQLLDAPDTSTPLGIRDKTMLEVFYSTGIRLSELCSLTVHDVDVDAGYVRVNAGKGNKYRMVPMGRKAGRYVREYLRHVRGRFTGRCRDERALFVGQRGRKIHFLIVERLIRAYAQAAGIRRRVTPHALRHTCATHMLRGGADMIHVQRQMGHASLATTQIYTRVAALEVKATHARTHPREIEPPSSETSAVVPLRGAIGTTADKTEAM